MRLGTQSAVDWNERRIMQYKLVMIGELVCRGRRKLGLVYALIGGCKGRYQSEARPHARFV